LFYYGNKIRIIFSCGIGKLPVVVKDSADKRTAHITSHGDHHVWRGDLVKGLAILRLFHINAVNLFYQPYRVLIDLRYGFGTCRVKVELATAQMLAKCFGDLTAAGIMHTKKCYLLFHLNGHIFPMHWLLCEKWVHLISISFSKY